MFQCPKIHEESVNSTVSVYHLSKTVKLMCNFSIQDWIIVFCLLDEMSEYW